MNSQSSRTKIIAGALAFSLLAGSPAVVSLGTTGVAYAAAAQNTPFSDVSAGHWAEKHIAKLALQGIVNGYTGGTFRPNNNVTQEEAVVMALRFAGLADEANLDESIVYPDSFKIGAYFKPYIMLAFKKGLLDQKLEYELAAGNTKTAWGSLPASREWVTKLLVKAIEEEDTAKSLESASSSFSDAAQVDAKYKGFVNAAVSLGLVKGVTTTKFDPKAAVNRASLATLFSRAENLYPIEYAGQTNGIITQVNSSSISIYSNKQDVTYEIGADTLFYTVDAETPITLSQLVPYTEVTIIGKAGKALYIESLGTTSYVKTISAKFDRLSTTSEKYFYAWVNDEPVKMVYDSNLVVKDTAGNTIKLSDVKRDTVLAVKQDAFRDTPRVVEITAAQTSGAGTVTGLFYSADSTLITYTNNDGSLESKFLAPETTVVVEGVKEPTVADLLRSVDEVKLTLNDEQKVTKIEVVNRNVKVLNGAKHVNYNNENKLLTVVDSSGTTPYVLFLNNMTKINYNGSDITIDKAVSYLTAGRKITLTYTGSSIVSMEFIYKQTGTLVSVNSSSSSITLKLANGSTVTVPYSSPIIQVAGVTSPTLSDLQAGNTVTALLDSAQDKASTIQVHKTIQYEVISANASTKRVIVKDTAQVQKELLLSGITITNESGTEVAIGSLTKGTILNIPYVGNTMLSVKTISLSYGTVSSVSSDSITYKTQAGATKTISLTSGVKVIKGTQTGTTSSLLAAGDRIEVYKDENEIPVVTVSVGEKRTFWEYNASEGILWTLKTSTNDNSNYFYISEDTKLLYNGSSLKLEAIKEGDTLVIYAFRNKAFEVVKQ